MSDGYPAADGPIVISTAVLHSCRVENLLLHGLRKSQSCLPLYDQSQYIVCRMLFVRVSSAWVGERLQPANLLDKRIRRLVGTKKRVIVRQIVGIGKSRIFFE